MNYTEAQQAFARILASGSRVDVEMLMAEVANRVDDPTIKAIRDATSYLQKSKLPINSGSIMETIGNKNENTDLDQVRKILKESHQVFEIEDIIGAINEGYNHNLIKRIRYMIGKKIDQGASSMEILSFLNKAIIYFATPDRRSMNMSMIANEILDMFNESYENNGIIGLNTGSELVNSRLGGGLQMNQMMIIGGRPSMGKTAFAMWLCHQLVRLNDDVCILFFSFDEEAKRLFLRILSIMTGMTKEKLKQSKQILDKEKYQKLVDIINDVRNWPIKFIDVPCTAPEMRLEAHTYARENPNKKMIAFVDHVARCNFLSGDITKEVTNVSRMMMHTKKELQMTWIPLSQLGRPDDKTKAALKRKPTKENLKWAGALEEDSDIVLLPYRPEYYGEQKFKFDNKEVDAKDKIIMIWDKCRDGSRGSDLMNCNIAVNKFSDS